MQIWNPSFSINMGCLPSSAKFNVISQTALIIIVPLALDRGAVLLPNAQVEV